MKKLAAFFIVLIALVAIAGCNRFKSKNEDLTNVNSVTTSNTTITSMEDSSNTKEGVVMEIPDNTNSQNSEENTESEKENTDKMINATDSNLAATGAGSLNILISMIISLIFWPLNRKLKYA